MPSTAAPGASKPSALSASANSSRPTTPSLFVSHERNRSLTRGPVLRQRGAQLLLHRRAVGARAGRAAEHVAELQAAVVRFLLSDRDLVAALGLDLDRPRLQLLGQRRRALPQLRVELGKLDGAALVGVELVEEGGDRLPRRVEAEHLQGHPELAARDGTVAVGVPACEETDHLQHAGNASRSVAVTDARSDPAPSPPRRSVPRPRARRRLCGGAVERRTCPLAERVRLFFEAPTISPPPPRSASSTAPAPASERSTLLSSRKSSWPELSGSCASRRTSRLGA